jgi:hypothetical protein
MSNRGITVIDVCRDLKIELTPELTWAVGNTVRDLYVAAFGCLPEKDLRQKTNGPGTHCFAVYPDSWRGKIEDVIHHHNWQRQAQGDLFA